MLFLLLLLYYYYYMMSSGIHTNTRQKADGAFALERADDDDAVVRPSVLIGVSRSGKGPWLLLPSLTTSS